MAVIRVHWFGDWRNTGMAVNRTHCNQRHCFWQHWWQVIAWQWWVTQGLAGRFCVVCVFLEGSNTVPVITPNAPITERFMCEEKESLPTSCSLWLHFGCVLIGHSWSHSIGQIKLVLYHVIWSTVSGQHNDHWAHGCMLWEPRKSLLWGLTYKYVSLHQCCFLSAHKQLKHINSKCIKSYY